MKVAAVVVTYNRKEELLKNIKMILSQSFLVDKYFIIDNHGNDGTKEFLLENNILNNPIIEYVYLPENIGGAGGFYTGLKMAYEQNYDYICLMDDDGRPYDNNMMKNIISVAQEKHKINKKLLINSLVLGPDKETLSFSLSSKIMTKADANKAMNDEKLIMNNINPFNGTLVSKELVEEIGYPNKDFFIKGDEQDYYLRSIKANAFVATVCNSLYFHPKLEKKSIKFLGKVLFSGSESPWKEYYRARNYTYMYKSDNKKIKYIKQNIQQLIFAIRFNPKKLETIKMILKGWHDGKKGKLGIVIKP